VLEGIELLRAKDGYGDGRTIAAYASVFDVAAEIHDQHGDYREVIDPHASTASYATALITSACSTRTARIWTAAPSGLGSVPIGRPVQIKADSTGLLTLSTLNRSQLADSVLEAVKAGACADSPSAGDRSAPAPTACRGPGRVQRCRWCAGCRSPSPSTARA